LEALDRRNTELRTRLSTVDAELGELNTHRSALQSALDALRDESSNLHRQMTRLGNESKSEDRAVLLRSAAKYLAGVARIDSGELVLYWDHIEFRGWRGNFTIPLGQVTSIESGDSHLPSRSGVPLIGRFSPGPPIGRETLIIHTAFQSGENQLAVIAGLPGTKLWNGHINTAIDAIEQRREMREQRAQASAGLGQSKADVDARSRENGAALAQLDAEIGRHQRDRQAIQRELSLPDWENKTLHLKGRDLQKQVDSQVKHLARDGWELVSTSSPRTDEMVVSLKRVRRV
jgi:hypothetical protein